MYKQRWSTEKRKWGNLLKAAWFEECTEEQVSAMQNTFKALGIVQRLMLMLKKLKMALSAEWKGTALMQESIDEPWMEIGEFFSLPDWEWEEATFSMWTCKSNIAAAACGSADVQSQGIAVYPGNQSGIAPLPPQRSCYCQLPLSWKQQSNTGAIHACSQQNTGAAETKQDFFSVRWRITAWRASGCCTWSLLSRNTFPIRPMGVPGIVIAAILKENNYWYLLYVGGCVCAHACMSDLFSLIRTALLK